MKNNSINLIRKDVRIKETVQVERDWYALFNVLIICLVISLAVVTTLFRLSLKSDLDEKKEKLANNINTNLNNASKEVVKTDLKSLSDKYTIYKDFKDQNIDVNKLETEISSLYPNIKIDKFSVQPNSNLVSVNLHIKERGYVDLPKFLNTLKQNPKFENSVLNNISFALPKDKNSDGKSKLIDNLSESDAFITQVSMTLDKSKLLELNVKEIN